MILDDSIATGVELGSFVIVEADRGEDLGVVVFIAARDSSLATTLHAANNAMRAGSENTLKKILRLASLHERADLPRKAKDEMDILSVIYVEELCILTHHCKVSSLKSHVFFPYISIYLQILDLSRNGASKIPIVDFTGRCRIPV